MCNVPFCSAPPTSVIRCLRCYREVLVCDSHLNIVLSQCDVCGGTEYSEAQRLPQLGPPPALPSLLGESQPSSSRGMDISTPAISVIQSLVDERTAASDSSPDPVAAPPSAFVSSIARCPYRQHQQLAWCASTDELMLPIRICRDKVVSLGHSFAAMSVREKYLQEESGVRIRSGAADGPNNALCELRLLLVNERCEALQIAVRFADQVGRHLLFRSTGGHVLWRDPGSGDEVVRTHLCHTERIEGYAADEIFVHAGCYSFFDTVVDDAEPRLATPEQYVTHHEESYRLLVGGSDNAQLFHHSEQAIFKMLFDYPNVVADVITAVLGSGAALGLTAGCGQPLRLVAISVDIYTTRSACVDCSRAASRTRENAQHFFNQVIRDVPRSLRAVVVDRDIRTVIRFACEVPFTGCPSPEALPELPAQPDALTLHALPSRRIAHRNGENEPDVVFQIVRLPVNSQNALPLLTTGSQSRELTAVERALRQHRELNGPVQRDQIPGMVQGSRLTGSHALLLALEFHLRWEREKPAVIPGIKGFFPAPNTLPFAYRLESIVRVAAALKVSAQDVVLCLVRNFRRFLVGHGQAAGPFDRAFMQQLLAQSVLAIAKDIQERHGGVPADMLELLKAIGMTGAGLCTAALATIEGEIGAALDEQTATGENRALNLAIDFGLMKTYRTHVRRG
jgi:hypothetical protein